MLTPNNLAFSYPPFKLQHSLKPIVMTSSYNKAEKKFLIYNIRSNERKIDCFCVKGEMSMMGKLLSVVIILMVLGVCISFVLARRIVKARSKLVALNNNRAVNLNKTRNKK